MKTAFLIFLLVLGALALWGALAAARVERRFPPTGIFVPVTGGRLHLRDIAPRAGGTVGPEHTIVMLHGASCNLLALTLPLAGPLSERFRVIAIDRPGHGHSDRPGGRDSASITRQAALIAEAMAAAGAPRAIVLAHSFAGAVALTLAMDHPERVAGLVLLSPASHPGPVASTGPTTRAACRWSTGSSRGSCSRPARPSPWRPACAASSRRRSRRRTT